MTFFHATKPEPEPEFDLPTAYADIPYTWRHKVRRMYVREQKGMCYYCHHLLSNPAPSFVKNSKVDKSLFPKHFFDSAIHLHHDHDTGMTLGAVHSYCNAVLWQYHGE